MWGHMSFTIHAGDCLDAMRAMHTDSVAAIVTDPPYGLSFMSYAWDRGVPPVAVWQEAYRVLRPGGRLLCFAGTRTMHRMWCNIEDAGFTIEDTVAWMYGSGFPKHRSKLKPAYEPICVARKGPSTPLNIDACRIETGDELVRPSVERHDNTVFGNGLGAGTQSTLVGRWPANVMLDEEAARLLDEQSGESVSTGGTKTRGALGDRVYGQFVDRGEPIANHGGLGDAGGASRFFYVAKASRAERNAGLEGQPMRAPSQEYGMGAVEGDSRKPTKCTASRPVENNHPTVKPVDLMRHLVRLVTPTDGVVLDPFMGSGTTGVACVLEARRFIGCELDPEYAEIARRRIANTPPSLFGGPACGAT
jgi:site-specific DNA-methyltransferase (adenine-specific)